MGALDSLFGIRKLITGATELVTRGAIRLEGSGWSIADDPANEQTVLTLAPLDSPDGRYKLLPIAPASRQGTATLATGSTFLASAACATNNRIHRTTWALRLKVGGVHYICDYYTETLRDGAGAISKLEGKLLGKTPPAGVTIAWATAAGVHQLSVSNTTGAAIEVWAAPSDLIEDIS